MAPLKHCLLLAALAALSASATDLVTQTFPPIVQQEVAAMAVDASGNLYLCGSFNSSSLDFNPGVGADEKTSAGSSDAFVTRINADGTYGWTQTFGGSSSDAATAIVVSGSVVYVVGTFSSSNAGIGGASTFLSSGLNDAFVIALDATTGAAVTTFGTNGIQRFGGSQNDSATGICVAGTNIYVCGTFASGNAGIGGTGAFATLGGTDGFVFALNATTGAAVTTFGSQGMQKIGGISSDGANAICAFSTDLYVAGEFASSGLGIGAVGGTGSTGTVDAFIAALDPATGAADANFGLSGIQKFGGAAIDRARAITANGSGVYVAGDFSSSDAGIGGAGPFGTLGGNDAFVLSLNYKNGSPNLGFGNNGVQRFSGTSNELGASIAAAGGNVYLAGEINSAAAGINGSATIATTGSSDAVVVALAGDTGAGVGGFGMSGAQKFGGTSSDSANAIAVFGTTLYLAGKVNSTDAGVGGAGSFSGSSFGGFLVRLNVATGASLENSPPTNIIISKATVSENNPIGTAIGTFSATDPDVGDTFTFTLVPGTGSTNNASFSITGATLSNAVALDFETAGNPSIRVRVTDQRGGSIDKLFTITVTNVLEAPTDITLSGNTINDKSPVGTTIGSFNTTSQEANSSPYALTLVVGTGDTDNASFSIASGSLRSAVVVDGLAKSSFSIRVRSTDKNALFFEKAFTITVSNVATAPTDISLSGNIIAENSSAGTGIGTFFTDSQSGSSFTYTFVAGAGDTDNASFSITGSTLRAAAVFDGLAQKTLAIRVRSTDQRGLFFDKPFTISVTHLNRTPTGIALSNVSIVESGPIGTAIGTFTTSDPDAGNTFTYTIAAGTDSASFSISGDKLLTAAAFDFNKQSDYSIVVTSTDQDGQFVRRTFALTVVTTPNSGADGIKNPSDGGPEVLNPVDALSVKVNSSNGGVIQLGVTLGGDNAGKTMSVTTEFADVPGRSALAKGMAPMHKFINHGIYIATITALDEATGTILARGRKTLVVGKRETGESTLTRDARGLIRDIGTAPTTVTPEALKGKFVFSGSKSDSVQFTGTFALPAGIDMSQPHDFRFSIGNVNITTMLDKKGKSTSASPGGIVKKLALTSKVKKKSVAIGGETATVKATFSAAGLTNLGFDTEGLTSRAKDVTPGKGSAARSIQIGIDLEGVPYQTLAPVEFGISKDSEFGTISARK